jgi:hypothetical protein
LARKNKKFPVFLVVLIVGIVVFGFAMLQTDFPDIIPLNVVLQRECNFSTSGFGQISFGEIECFQSFNRFSTDNLPFQLTLPLSGVDVNSPMDIEFDFDVFTIPSECTSFIDNNVELTLTDGSGNIIHTAVEGMVVDISQFLLPDQQVLFINFDDRGIGICPTSNLIYDRQISSGIAFQQKPPEIREDKPKLLEQWLYLANFRDQQVEENSTRFAIAESFKINEPTVITDLRVRIGSALTTSTSQPKTNDFSATITAFVWNLDSTPPLRLAQSTESFTGIRESRAELDLDFTVPNSVVLLPNDITYGVGIRVDQNLDQEFAYTKSDQIANTHECVIDRNSSLDGEISFVSNGLCGFDIGHSQFLAFSILSEGQETGQQGIQGEQGLEGIAGIQGIQGIEGIQGEPASELTQEELLEIICEGRTDALCRETNSLLGLFMIGESSFDILLLIAGIIIFIGIIGFIVRRR